MDTDSPAQPRDLHTPNQCSQLAQLRTGNCVCVISLSCVSNEWDSHRPANGVEQIGKRRKVRCEQNQQQASTVFCVFVRMVMVGQVRPGIVHVHCERVTGKLLARLNLWAYVLITCRAQWIKLHEPKTLKCVPVANDSQPFIMKILNSN